MFHTCVFFFFFFSSVLAQDIFIYFPYQTTLNCVFIFFLVSLTLLGMLCFVVRFSRHCGHLDSDWNSGLSYESYL